MQIDILVIRKILSILKEYKKLSEVMSDLDFQEVDWVIDYLERVLLNE